MIFKEKILDYLKMCWSKNIHTNKSVSLVITLCFLINIANLPVYASFDAEMSKKQIKNADKQTAVLSHAALKSVNEQIGAAVNIKAEIDSAARKELDRKDIAITAVGAIIERSRDGKREIMIGSLDEKGKVNIHSGGGRQTFDKKTKEEYEFRARQALDMRVARGKFAATHSKEYLALEKSITIKEALRKIKKEIALGKGKAQKADSREILQNQLITKETIGRIYKIAKKAGLILTEERNVSDEKAKIEIYTSKNTGKNIFVGKTDGAMAYPTYNGRIEIAESRKKIKIDGDEFESSGIAIVKSSLKSRKNYINKKTEGLFFIELLNVLDKDLSDEQTIAIKELFEARKEEKSVLKMPANIVKYIEDKAGIGLSKRICQSVEKISLQAEAAFASTGNAVKALNKGAFALQPVLIKAAIAKDFKNNDIGDKEIVKESKVKEADEFDNALERAQYSVEMPELLKETAKLTANDIEEYIAAMESVQKEAVDIMAAADEKSFEETENFENLSVDNGVIYERDADGLKQIGIWDGEQAYIAQADGQLKESESYTRLILNREKSGQAAKGYKLEKGVVSKIKDFISSIANSESVNCAIDAISQTLGAANKGILAFQAVIADLAAGVFVSNNQGYLSGESQDVMISMDAMKNVVNYYGADFEGHSAKAGDIAASLKDGESAVLHVKADSAAASENHFITIELAKDKDANAIDTTGNSGAQDRNIIIKDPNKENIIVKESELASVLALEYGVSLDSGIKVLSESGIKNANKLTQSEMLEAAGAASKKTSSKTSSAKAKTSSSKSSSSSASKKSSSSSKSSSSAKQSSKSKSTSVKSSSKSSSSSQKSGSSKAQKQISAAKKADNAAKKAVAADKSAAKAKKAADKAKKQADKAAKAAQKASKEKDPQKKINAQNKAAKKADEAKKKAVQARKAAQQAKTAHTKARKAAQKVDGKDAGKAIAKEKAATKKLAQAKKAEKAAKADSKKANKKLVKTVKETVKDINGGKLPKEAKAAIDALSKAAKKGYDALVQASINAGKTLLEKNADKNEKIKDTGLTILSIASGNKSGVVVDKKKKTITNYGDGTKTEQIKFGKDVSEKDIDNINKIAANGGYDAVLNYTKQSGKLLCETKYDKSGKEIYTAVNVGYKDGTMALKYDFASDYSNETTIVEAKKGDSKVVFEEYGGQENGYLLKRAMTYSSSKDGYAQRNITADGLEFSADIRALERATEFYDKEITASDGSKEKVRAARSVDFKGSDDENPSAFEEAVIDKDGNINVTRYDLTNAISDTEIAQKEGGAASNSAGAQSLIDQYKGALDAAKKMRIIGKEDLYAGYAKVDNKYIDMSKVETYSYNTANSGYVTKNTTIDGKDASITAKLESGGWRYDDRNISSNSQENSVTITSKTDDGGTRIDKYLGVTLDNDFNYENTEGCGQEWSELNAKGEVVKGGADYKKGNVILMPGSKDKVELDKDLSYTYQKNSKGKFDVSAHLVSGKYVNIAPNGKAAYGTLENCKFTINENGTPSLSGKINIKKGSSFYVEKGKSKGSSSSGKEKDKSKPDAKDTDAKVVEKEDGYVVKDGSVSLRNGGLVVMGTGAVFKKGSNLEAIGGKITKGSVKVKTDKNGNYVYTSHKSKKTTVKKNNSEVKSTTIYDKKGEVKTTAKNKKTGAAMTRERDGSKMRVTITAKKKGDTGFGYEVEKLGKNGKAVYSYSINGKNEIKNETLTSGAVITQTIMENKADGQKIFNRITGKSGDSVSKTMRYYDGNRETALTMAGDVYVAYDVKKNLAYQIGVNKEDADNPLSKTKLDGKLSSNGKTFILDKSIVIQDDGGNTKYYYKKINIDKKSSAAAFVDPRIKAKLNDDGNWYDVSDMGKAGGGKIAVGTSEDGKPIYMTLGSDGVWHKIKAWDGKSKKTEANKVGNFTVKKNYDGKLILSTNKKIKIPDASGKLSINAKGDFLLGRNKDGRIVLTTTKKYFAKYAGSNAKIKLQAGAKLGFTNGSLSVSSGELKIDGSLTIKNSPNASEGGASGDNKEKPKVKTRAVISYGKNGVKVSNGILSIRDGQLTVEGKGAVFLKGSLLSDGSRVTKGNLKIADYTKDGYAVYVAEKGTAQTRGSISINYNKKGVTWAGTSRTVKGNFRVSNGDVYSHYTTTTTYKISKSKGYNVMARNSKGQYIVARTVTKAAGTKIFDMSDYKAQVEAYKKSIAARDEYINAQKFYDLMKNKPLIAPSYLSDLAKKAQDKKEAFIKIIPDSAMKNISDFTGLTKAQIAKKMTVKNGNIVIPGVIKASEVIKAPNVIVKNPNLKLDLAINRDLTFSLTTSHKITYLDKKTNTSKTVYGVETVVKDDKNNRIEGIVNNIDIVFERDINTNKAYTITGFDFVNITQQGYVQKIPKSAAGAGTGGAQGTPAIKTNTQGIFNITKDTITVSGQGSVISFRNGEVLLAGEGAQAWSGSTFTTRLGKVQTKGSYTYKDGGWAASSQYSTYSYYDASAAKKAIISDMKSSGIKIDSLNDLSFKNIGGNIPSNSFGALEALLNSTDNRGKSVAAVTVKDANGKEPSINGIKIAAGYKIKFAVDGENKMGVYCADTRQIKSSYTLAQGWTSADGKSKVGLLFNYGDKIDFGVGFKNEYGAGAVLNGNNIQWNNGTGKAQTINNVRVIAGADGILRLGSESLNFNYNGGKLSVALGSEVTIGGNAIVVTKGSLIAEGVNLQDSPSFDEEGGSDSNKAWDGSVNFDGIAKKAANGKTGWDISGIINGYSDGNLETVLSKGYIFSEGSIFGAGSDIYVTGETVESGKVQLRKTADGYYFLTSAGASQAKTYIDLTTSEQRADGFITRINNTYNSSGLVKSEYRQEFTKSDALKHFAGGTYSGYEITNLSERDGGAYIFSEFETTRAQINGKTYNIAKRGSDGQFIINESSTFYNLDIKGSIKDGVYEYLETIKMRGKDPANFESSMSIKKDGKYIPENAIMAKQQSDGKTVIVLSDANYSDVLTLDFKNKTIGVLGQGANDVLKVNLDGGRSVYYTNKGADGIRADIYEENKGFQYYLDFKNGARFINGEAVIAQGHLAKDAKITDEGKNEGGAGNNAIADIGAKSGEYAFVADGKYYIAGKDGDLFSLNKDAKLFDKNAAIAVYTGDNIATVIKDGTTQTFGLVKATEDTKFLLWKTGEREEENARWHAGEVVEIDGQKYFGTYSYTGEKAIFSDIFAVNKNGNIGANLNDSFGQKTILKGNNGDSIKIGFNRAEGITMTGSVSMLSVDGENVKFIPVWDKENKQFKLDLAKDSKTQIAETIDLKALYKEYYGTDYQNMYDMPQYDTDGKPIKKDTAYMDDTTAQSLLWKYAKENNLDYSEASAALYSARDDPFKITVTRTKTLADYVFSKDFDGNTGEFKFSIESMIFDLKRMQFITTANVFLDKTNKFNTTGSWTAAPAGAGSGGGSEPKEVYSTKYRVGAEIGTNAEGGASLSLYDYGGTKEQAQVSITFDTSEMFSGKAIAGHSFASFKAGTEVVLVKQTQLKYVDNNARTESNRHEKHEIKSQVIEGKAEAGTRIFCKTDTALSGLVKAAMDNGVVSGSIDILQTIEIDNAKYAAEGTVYSNKTFANTAVVKQVSGAGVEGAELKNGKLEFGMWSLKGNINLKASSVELESHWLTRAGETVLGVITSIAALINPFDWISGNKLAKFSASLFTDKQIDQIDGKDIVSTYIAAAVAIAAVVTTVVSFGAAATFWAAAALAASAVTTAAFASTAAFQSAQCFQNGDWKGGLLNAAAAALAIAFPLKLSFGNPIAAMNGALNAVKGMTGGAVKTMLFNVVKNPLGLRAVMGAGFTGLDFAISALYGVSADEGFGGGFFGELGNLVRILSFRGAAIDGGSFWNRQVPVFGELGLRWGHIAWASAYILGPDGLAKGIKGVKNIFNAKTSAVNFTTPALNGLQVSASTVKSLTYLAGRTNFIKSWGAVARHMYQMWGLQIGMGIAGNIVKPFGQSLNNSIFKDVYDFIMSEMGGTEILGGDRSMTVLFGAVMAAAMPFVQGVAQGFKNKIPGVEPAANGAAQEASKGIAGRLKRLANGIMEEGFSENIAQAFAMKYFGLSPEMAEYFSEFVSPGGGTNLNSNAAKRNYGDSVGKARLTSLGVSNASNAMNNILMENGVREVKADADFSVAGFSKGNAVIRITNREDALSAPAVYNVSTKKELQLLMVSVGAAAVDGGNAADTINLIDNMQNSDFTDITDDVLINYAAGARNINGAKALEAAQTLLQRYQDAIGEDAAAFNAAMDGAGNEAIGVKAFELQEKFALDIAAIQAEKGTLSEAERVRFEALQDANEMAVEFSEGNISMSEVVKSGNLFAQEMLPSWTSYQEVMAGRIQALADIVSEIKADRTVLASKENLIRRLERTFVQIEKAVIEQNAALSEKSGGIEVNQGVKEIFDDVKEFDLDELKGSEVLANGADRPMKLADAAIYSLINSRGFDIDETIKETILNGETLTNEEADIIKNSHRYLYQLLQISGAISEVDGVEISDEQAWEILTAEYIMLRLEPMFNKDIGGGAFRFTQKQRSPFTNIAKTLLSEAKEGEEGKARRLTQEVATGGGKTYLAAISAMLLLANGNTEGQFVGAFTNTIDNAANLQKTMKNIFGGEFLEGNIDDAVILLSASEYDEARQDADKAKAFREKLKNARVVCADYSAWASITASDWAGLVANEQNKESSRHIRELLEAQGIKLTKDNRQFENATQARQASKILIEAARNGDEAVKKALEETVIPMDKIGDVVADEIDFFGTIPMQALATSNGKYFSAQSMLNYYNDIKSGMSEEKLLEKYSEAGVTNAQQIKQDMALNGEQIDAKTAILNDVSSLLDNNHTKIDINGLQVKEMLKKYAADAEQIKSLIDNHNKEAYFYRLAQETQGLYESSAKKLGGLAKSGILAKIVATEFSRESLLSDMMSIYVDESGYEAEVREADKQTAQTDAKKIEDVQKDIVKKAEQLKKEFEGAFFGENFTDAEIIEQVRNGMGAHELVLHKDYNVVNGRVVVINEGHDVENLSLPAGMMQVLEVKERAQVSKPNTESYVSNSVFAMSLFDNLVGLTGTVSSMVDINILRAMGVERFGETSKPKASSKLLSTKKGMAQYVYEAAKLLTDKNIANFQLTLTPNSEISHIAFNTIINSIKADLLSLGVSETDADIAVKALTDTSDNFSLNLANIKAEFAEKYKINAVEISKIMTNTVLFADSAMNEEQLKSLSDKVKSGEYKYIIGDAYLIGRGWDVGDMRDSLEKLKAAQNITDKEGAENRGQVNCWLLDGALMTEAQMIQGAGRIDPYGSNRFDAQYYSKDIISLYSVETLRTIDKLTSKVASNKKKIDATEINWDINDVLDNDNLTMIQEYNEEQALLRAGQQTKVLESKRFEQTKTDTKQEAPSVSSAIETLSKLGIDANNAKQAEILNKYIPTLDVKDTDRQLTMSEWFVLENIANYLTLANVAGVKAEELSSLLPVEGKAFTSVKEGGAAGALEYLNSALKERNVEASKEFTDLYNAASAMTEGYED
ncbi:MAG: hypothetical protein LBO62_06180, partial [Endomicrobium sp.]|nr:hypothetical protein [Endomicrobium sp.]